MIFGLLLVSAPLHAGMPSFTLDEVASLRLETLSFFIALFLLCGLGLKLLWNQLARDFTRLPRLTYCRSLGLLALWGPLFVLLNFRRLCGLVVKRPWAAGVQTEPG